MKLVALLILACLPIFCLQSSFAGDPISPLFRARLDATMAEWERSGEAGGSSGEGAASWPMSASRESLCIGSMCMQSHCMNGRCLRSECIGSGCATSLCGGSACVGVSLCPKKCSGNDGAADRADPDYSNLTYTWGPCRGM